MEKRIQDIKIKSNDKERMELIKQKYSRNTSKLSNNIEVEDSIILNTVDMEVLRTNANEGICSIGILKQILEKDVALNIEQTYKLSYIPKGTNEQVKYLKLVNKFFTRYNEILATIYRYLSEVIIAFYYIRAIADEIIEGKKENLKLKDVWNLSLGYEMIFEVNHCIEQLKDLENDWQIDEAFRNTGVKKSYNLYQLNLENGKQPCGLSLYISYYNRIMRNYNIIVGLDKTSFEFNVDKDKKIYEYIKDFMDYK